MFSSDNHTHHCQVLRAALHLHQAFQHCFGVDVAQGNVSLQVAESRGAGKQFIKTYSIGMEVEVRSCALHSHLSCQ
jgi:hypothetical protein